MNLLTKLFQFFINLLSPKTTKTPKATKNLTIPKTNLTKTSHDHVLEESINIMRTWYKTSKKSSPNIPIKQVSKTSKTITPLSRIIKTRWSPKDKKWTYSNGESPTSKLEPGTLFDSCVIMSFEDFLQELKKQRRDIIAKLHNKRVYVLSTSREEYANKKCPRNYLEKFLWRQFTGKPRNFKNTLTEIQKLLGVKIYLIEIKNSAEIKRISEEFIIKFHESGLHRADSPFAAFAYITKSTLVTLDHDLISSSKKAKVKVKDFSKFLGKILGNSTLKKILREYSLSQEKDTHVVLMYGNRNSFTSRRKR